MPRGDLILKNHTKPATYTAVQWCILRELFRVQSSESDSSVGYVLFEQTFLLQEDTIGSKIFILLLLQNKVFLFRCNVAEAVISIVTDQVISSSNVFFFVFFSKDIILSEIRYQ